MGGVAGPHHLPCTPSHPSEHNKSNLTTRRCSASRRPPRLTRSVFVTPLPSPTPSLPQAVSSLPFLEAHVQRALAAGAAPYLPAEARGAKAADAGAKGERGGGACTQGFWRGMGEAGGEHVGLHTCCTSV